MIRRVLVSLIFGISAGLLAQRQSGQAAGIAAGVLSAASFWTISGLLRARALRRKGKSPSLGPGEEALLYGPCEVSDQGGNSRAWAYLSNRRLMLRDEEGGAEVDMALPEIDELRLEATGVVVVSRRHGLLRLKLPDPKRWQKALQQAARA